MSRYGTGRPAARRPSGSGSRGAAHSSARRRVSWDTQEIDRYNVVDRDIYSSSSKHRSVRQARKRGGGCAKKFFTLLLILVLAGGGAAFIYFHVMASRLNRPGDVTSSELQQYVQLPSGASAWNDSGAKNILLLGVDENEDGTDGRSDTNMLISIDSKSKTLRLVSFLRDSYLEIPTLGKRKLNAAYANGGVAMTMGTLITNYHIDMDRYVSVNFENFAAVIDKMGGLDVPMSKSACRYMNKNMGTGLKTGTNHLNGKLCLYYARIRDASDDFGSNDYGRTGRQRQVVQLMIQKMKSMNLIDTHKVLYDYLPYVKTNLTDGELLSLAALAPSLSDYKMETMQAPAPHTFDDTVKVNGGKVIKLDLEKNRALLRDFLSGGSSDESSGE